MATLLETTKYTNYDGTVSVTESEPFQKVKKVYLPILCAENALLIWGRIKIDQIFAN